MLKKAIILCATFVASCYGMGKPSVDIAYVKEKYETKRNGIDCLIYPAQNPQRMLVLFYGAVPNKYLMWSWFWDEQEQWNDTLYLFLKDDARSWYFGPPKDLRTQTYCDIITDVMHEYNLSAQQTYTLGHSMGGHAALRFAFLLNLAGACAFRAQVNWEHGCAGFKSIKRLSYAWVDIDTLVAKHKYTPLIYLQFGNSPADRGAGEVLLNALLKKQMMVLVEKTEDRLHSGFYPSRDYIEETIAYMEFVNQSRL